jgi:glucokinase
MTRRYAGYSGESAVTIYGGIDLGGTKIQAAIIDAEHNVLGAKRDQTPLKGGPPAIAAKMVEVLRVTAEEAGVEPSALEGIGVGSPGSVDDKAGTVATAKNLSDWGGTFNLREVLESELGAPVSLGNDVDLAVDAEFEVGAAKDYQSLLGVFWGTGVGGGIILDGKPWLGRGTAAEIGHMVVKVDGARCPCGRRGCMEAYAGRGAMEARARRRVEKGEKTHLFKIMEERGRDRLSSGIWERALERGDKMAQELLEEAIEALGNGVASAVNLLDPEAVVIGGGLGIRLGQPWVEKLREAMLPHLFVDTNPPAILLAELGDLGGAHGGALLAARRARAKA